jgi:hypothetical protein
VGAVRPCMLWFMVLSWVSLTGCASIDPAAVRAQVAGKRIVVFATVPNELPLSWIGTTVFNNEFATVVSEKWPVRDWAQQRAVTLLSNQVLGLGIQVEGGEATSVSDQLKLAATNNDIVLDIYAVYGPDPIFQVPPFIRGVGVRQRSTYGSTPTSATYVMLGAALVEGQSRKVVASITSEGHQRLPFVALDTGPALKMNVEADVRASIKTQIDMIVFELLSRLGLLR